MTTSLSEVVLSGSDPHTHAPPLPKRRSTELARALTECAPRRCIDSRRPIGRRLVPPAMGVVMRHCTNHGVSDPAKRAQHCPRAEWRVAHAMVRLSLSLSLSAVGASIRVSLRAAH